MCLFDEFFCLCLVDARKMAIKPDCELKSWQRISLPIRAVCGLLVDLTECDISRYLDITELFVLLVGHKTNCTGETCRVAGSKQLLGIRCTGFAWSTDIDRIGLFSREDGCSIGPAINLSSIGYWLLAIGYWLLAIVYWLCASPCYLFF